MLRKGSAMNFFGLFGSASKQPVKPELLATQNGEIIRVEELKDGIFSEKLLGDGFALRPSAGEVFAPASGVINQIADTMHAYGITTEDGLEILVHIGIDTAFLKGAGFRSYVRLGQRIKAGAKIAFADLDFIRAKGYRTDTAVVITNIDMLKSWGAVYGICEAAKTIALIYEK